MSTMTTSLKTQGFGIPSALDYTKVIAKIGSGNSNVSTIGKVCACVCNCPCSCDCGRHISSSASQALTW
jgi:hypothetical protein